MPSTEFSMDEESLKFLEQVKKSGKSRRFVMICKGPKIVSLVIYKKGAVAGHIKKAKEQGTGEAFFGVVGGKGPALEFLLSKQDSFDKEPTTAVKLREFINDATGETYKPFFTIVDQLPAVLDDDDPLVQRFLALQPRILEACDRSEDVAKFFNDLCLETGKALEEGNSQAAEMKIAAIEKALAQTEAPRTETKPDSEVNEFAAALGKLKPAISEACVAFPQRKTELLGLVADVQKRAAAGETKEAKESLAKLAELLKSLKKPTTTETSETTDTSGESNDSGGPSLVVLQQARLVWEQSRKKIQAEIEKLEKSIVASVKEDGEIGDGELDTSPLRKILDKLDHRLTKKLDAALNAETPKERAALNGEAKLIVEEYREFIKTNKLMAAIDTSGFEPVSVNATAVSALEVLSRKL